ncbi:MAG: deoxynucleoside kinase [Firmicutes bacterium]|nr:deoxynucleoside kinase [Bacillota bacterium]
MKLGIIGPNGAGKSLLSRKLATYYHCKLVEEPVANNPYLPYFYNDKETFSLLAQNAFYSALFLLMWQTKDEKDIIYDSTLHSNLVYTELIRLEGFLTATEVALTYAIADEHIKRLPELDLQIIIVRSTEALFKNVHKRGREIEKGQEEYLNFHYANYYPAIRRILKNYKFPEKKTLFLEIDDMEVPAEFARIVSVIEKAYLDSLK